MAKRGEGITLEEGTLVFVNGQITEAHVGRLREAEARNWLSTWGSCRFMFVPTPDAWGAPVKETEVHVYKPSLPVKGSAARSPTRGPPPHMTNTNWSDPQTPMPSSIEGQEGPQRAGAGGRNDGHARTDTPAARAPYPIQQPDAALRLIEQHGLSRIHRQLFYLIDGRRSIVELTRLTRKSGSEIYKMLGDLERAHVIRIT